MKDFPTGREDLRKVIENVGDCVKAFKEYKVDVLGMD